jgi:hypothetical protein
MMGLPMVSWATAIYAQVDDSVAREGPTLIYFQWSRYMELVVKVVVCLISGKSPVLENERDADIAVAVESGVPARCAADIPDGVVVGEAGGYVIWELGRSEGVGA